MPMTCPSCGTANLEGVDECAHCGHDLRSVDKPKAASQLEESLMHLPLTALDMATIHAVTPDTTVEEAVLTLNRQKLDCLEVVENGALIGLLSVRDIMNRVGPDYRKKLQTPVRQFMTPKPETLPPDAPITFAINKMDVGGYRHVPVVQEGRILGIVSVRDVIRHIVKHSRQSIATHPTPK